MGYRLGIDVGGTFTDLALLNEESGLLAVGKVPSIPADPSRGILDGIVRILADAGVGPDQIAYLAHGTTVATNTLLQRKGAKTEERFPSKVWGHPLKPGDRVQIITPGGGGYGPPLRRGG